MLNTEQSRAMAPLVHSRPGQRRMEVQLSPRDVRLHSSLAGTLVLEAATALLAGLGKEL